MRKSPGRARDTNVVAVNQHDLDDIERSRGRIRSQNLCGQASRKFSIVGPSLAYVGNHLKISGLHPS